MTTNYLVQQADATAFIQGLPGESIDLVVTDPAYESLEKHRKIGTTTRLSHSKSSSNDWFQIFPNSRFPQLLEALWVAMAKDSHLYCYCDFITAQVVVPLAEAVGFRFWNDICWNKVTMGMGYHYRRQKEIILFFEKGKRRLNDLGISDVITCPRVRGGYPTEKPVAVSEVLILNSSSPGELVVDPFVGSGSVGEAALRNGREFAGCDIAASAVELATTRLQKVVGEHGNQNQ